MRLVASSSLKRAINKHSILKTPLGVWKKQIEKADWQTPQDVLKTFSKARPIGPNRIIFGIMKNDFRIVVHCQYSTKMVFIKFIGTHSEYDNIDPERVQHET
jgi:mRNA interferase HigB